MKKRVNFCGNCPFMHTEYDDFAIGDSTTDICTLSSFLKKEEYIISSHNSIDIFYKNDTPKWCPLKDEKIELEYKPFSEKRQKEINDIKSKIIKLSNEIDDNDNIEIDDIKYEKLNELNSKLDLLFKNEDVNIDDFSEELKDSVNEINNQIEELVKSSETLSKTFINLDKNNEKD